MGDEEYDCTPWGSPAYNIFGWQKPCYLMQEGYAKTFAELMETTEWENYGRPERNQKCANCLVHCGFEPTSVDRTFTTWRGFWQTARATLTGQSADPRTSRISRSSAKVHRQAFSYRSKPSSGHREITRSGPKWLKKRRRPFRRTWKAGRAISSMIKREAAVLDWALDYRGDVTFRSEQWQGNRRLRFQSFEGERPHRSSYCSPAKKSRSHSLRERLNRLFFQVGIRQPENRGNHGWPRLPMLRHVARLPSTLRRRRREESFATLHQLDSSLAGQVRIASL